MNPLFGRLRSAIYRLYENRLARQVRVGPIPTHIGLILDGNRRYGRQHNVTAAGEVYLLGASKLDELLEWCAGLEVPIITLWVFSTDNFDRSPAEVSGILKAIETKMWTFAKAPEIGQRDVRVRAMGQLELLPESTLLALRSAEAATRHNKGVDLIIAAGYGGRQEIVDAVQLLLRNQADQGRSLVEAIPAVTVDAIRQHLYAPDLPDPDLIIRTSGEIRLSGFLLWQSVYSEFYFTDVFWPAFRRIDLLRAIRAFQQRTRRRGR